MEDGSFAIPEGLQQDGVYWAQMTGHPHWPVRLCSPPEARKLESFRPRRVQQQVPVFFLSSLNSAWVNRNQIELFDADSCARRVDEKKFKTSRAYRWAIIEAMRVVLARGAVFPTKLYALVTNCEGHVDWNTTADVCTVCSGTELSGEALVCDLCNSAETHFHCLRPQIMSAPTGNWYCEGCLKIKGLPPGYMPPEEPAIVEAPVAVAAEESSAEDVAIGGGKRRGGRSSAAVGGASAPAPPGGRGVGHLTPAAFGGSSARRSARDSLQSITSIGYANEDGARVASSQSEVPPTQGSRRALEGADIFGRTNGVFNGTVRPAFGCPLTVEDDDCFVCGLEGSNNIICDYPGCRRTYHQACIAKTYPVSLCKSYPNLPVTRHPVYKRADEKQRQVDMVSVEKEFEASVSDGIDEGLFDVYSKIDRTWICPAHFCVRCNSLSCGNGMPELDRASIPSYLLAYGDRKGRKALSSCSRCPMSVCLDCESDIGGGVPLVVLIPPAAAGSEGIAAASMASSSAQHHNAYDDIDSIPVTASASKALETRVKFGTESCKLQLDSAGVELGNDVSSAGNSKNGSRGYVRTPRNSDKDLKEILMGKKVVIPSCLNCNSRNARLSLAKSLEKMCGNIFRSRLSLPFLRPLLPCSTLKNVATELATDLSSIDRIMDISGARGVYERGILEGVANSTEAGEEVSDLLSILEKVRRLRYSSFKDVLLDLEKLKGIIVHFLLKIDPNCLQEELSIKDGQRPQLRSILLAFDSLIDSALLYDETHKVSHRKLERAIDASGRDCGGMEVEDAGAAAVEGAEAPDAALPPSRKRSRLEVSTGRSSRARHELMAISSDLKDDEAAAEISGDVAGACREVMGFWRSECEKSLDGGFVSQYKVEARSIGGWCHFLVHGAMPLDSVRPPAGKDAPGAASSRGTTQERADVAKWLRVLDASELSDELEAAHIMSGMRYSVKREAITLCAMDTLPPELLEPEPVCPDAAAATGGGAAVTISTGAGVGAEAGLYECGSRPQRQLSPAVEGFAEDGNLLLLEQLQRLARQSLLLGSQLQSQLKHQSLGASSSSSSLPDTVTIGEARIVSELRLANDNLRWRCQQKERALAAFAGVVAQLRSENEALTTRLGEQQSEIEKLRGLKQGAAADTSV